MVKDQGPFPVAQADEQRLDRRKFLRGAAAVAVAVGCGKALARLSPETSAPAPELESGWSDSLALNEARALTAGDHEVLAVRLSRQQVVAYDRRCPHLGCPVIWSAESKRFECPCHHAAFDAATGAVLFGPPRRGLTPVTIKA